MEDERDDGSDPRDRVDDGGASGDDRGPSPDPDVPDGRAGAEGGGLGLLAGLNVIPKRSFLSEYSSRVGHKQIT